jgi:hypothetical protein
MERDLRAEGWCPEDCYPETDAGSNSAALDCCIANPSEEGRLKRSKAKRCWICGNKLRGGKNYPRTIDGHKRDMHKFCAEEHDKAEARSDNAFGMEY